MKRFLSHAALLLSIVLCLAASGCRSNRQLTVYHCGEEPLNDPSSLKVGVRTTIMNFSVLNKETGRYYGLEVDLAVELAKRLNYNKLELITTHAETREEDLESGRVDVVLAIYTETDERRQVVDFSPPYYYDSEQLVIQKSTRFEDLSDLKGLTVAVHEGTSTKNSLIDLMVENGVYASVAEAGESMNFIEIASYGDMFDSIEQGRTDALIVDGCIARAYINTERQTLRYLRDIDYCAGTRRGSDMSARVARVMQDMIDDGTVQRLTDKWE